MRGKQKPTTYKRGPGNKWRHQVVLFRDVAGKWRFRISHKNGQVIATTEAYANYTMAHRTAVRMMESIQEGRCVMFKEAQRVI